MDESTCSGRAKEAIAETRAAFVVALRDGDTATASAVYADDARLLAPPTELIQGRAAIEEFWKAGLYAGIAEVALDAVEVEREHELAYEIGLYSLRLQPKAGETIVEHGKYVLVHERQGDGSWRRAVEVFNPDAPLPTTPDRAPRQRSKRRR